MQDLYSSSDNEDDTDEDDEDVITRYDGRKITVDGRRFDVPSWMSDADLEKGLRSDDPMEPLSSLVALDHIEGSDGEYCGGEAYHAQFLVPFNSYRLLCLSEPGFALSDYSDIDAVITRDGLLVSFDVIVPNDFSEVEAYYYPDTDEGLEAMSSAFDKIDGLAANYTPDDIREALDKYDGSIFNSSWSGGPIRRDVDPVHGPCIIGVCSDND